MLLKGHQDKVKNGTWPAVSWLLGLNYESSL